MSLDIPINITAIDTSSNAIPTRTPRIDFESGRILGYCDDREAITQAIKLTLLSARFSYLIYDNQYGSELLYLNRDSPAIWRSGVERSVKDALLCDDRILSVSNFSITSKGDVETVRFSVNTIFGAMNEEVNIHV